MRIVIKSKEVEVRRGKVAATGREYSIAEQSAYIVTDDETRRFKFALPDGAAPYEPGEYSLSGESFEIDQYKSLTVKRVKLVAVKAAAARAA